MFWAIAVGIATGAKMYPLALIGSLVIGATLAWLSKKKTKHQAYLLIIRHTDEATYDLRVQLRKLEAKLKSKSIRNNYIEQTVEINLRDDNTAFMKTIDDINGVIECSLVNYTGDYAQ